MWCWRAPTVPVATLPYPDKELTRLGIDEGSRVHLLPDGTLQKISEELL